MQTVTVGSPIVKELLEGAELKGYSAEDILKRFGLPVELLTNPKFRVSTLKLSEFSDSLVSLLKDEAFGTLAQPMALGTWEVLFRASLSARDLQESLVSWKNTCNLLKHSVTVDLEIDDHQGSIIFDCESAPGITGNNPFQTQLLAVHRYHCWLTNEFIPIEKVEVTHPEPDYYDEYRTAYYGAPIFYNQQRNALTFSAKSLALVCNRDKEEFEQWIQNRSAQILMLPRHSSSISTKIRWWIEKVLREGRDPLQLDAAEYVGLTPQTLRRRLAKDGQTFYQLKEETRRDVSIHLLKESDLSVEQVAFQIGFSEASTFIRAFKKWTGMTPLTYRRL